VGDEPYKPMLAQVMGRYCAENTANPVSPGYLLVPKAIRFPHGMTLPVGLVMRPSAINVENLRALVTIFAVPPKDGDTKWLDNAILDVWLTAAANNPKTFAMPAYPHSYMVDAFNATSPPAVVSIRLYQEWALLAYLVNHQVNKLANYASALLSANNITGPNALANVEGWGFVEAVWRHPFLTRLRPITAETMQELGGKWTVFSDAPEDTLPAYMNGVPCVKVGLPNRGVPTFPPIRKVLKDPNEANAENAQNLNLLRETGEAQHMVDPLLQFEELEDADNPFFGASPVVTSDSNKQ
jgi:hypothetical protein